MHCNHGSAHDPAVRTEPSGACVIVAEVLHMAHDRVEASSPTGRRIPQPDGGRPLEDPTCGWRRHELEHRSRINQLTRVRTVWLPNKRFAAASGGFMTTEGTPMKHTDLALEPVSYTHLTLPTSDLV